MTALPARLGASGRGIVWMLLTMLLFVGMNTLTKLLTERYPVPQVVWARYAFHFVLLAVLLGGRLPAVAAASRRPGFQLLRSFLLALATALMISALAQLQLVDAAAILFLTPILVTALSVPLLGEPVGPRRWAGVALGCLGALMIVRPGLGVVQPAALLALGTALCNALYQVATRRLGQIDPLMTTAFYTALVGAVLATLVVPFVWVAPRAVDWGWMVAVGALGGISHLTLIKAFEAAPAAVVAPFAYSSIVWSTLFGFLVFGELPDGWTVAGAGVIMAGGLYIFHREQVRRRPVTPNDPP